MYKLFILIIAAISIQQAAAQKIKPPQDSSLPITDLEEVVVSAGNFGVKNKNVAQKIVVISAKTIASSNAQNMGDLLSGTGKVFVQKSQQGASSPVLRGFEASRILLVVDGVRMNNAIYRSGHLQNAITVDQNSLTRVEVMFGAASTTYGSDALGGAIQFFTKSPIFSTTKKTKVTGSSFARFSSANNEKTLHADISIGGKKLAWLQSYNFSDFNDLRMGSNYAAKYPDFGKRNTYIGQVNGVDSVLKNENALVQKFSGYKQWDITQKVSLKQTEKITHALNIQISNSTNVPRYDRLQDVRNFGGSIGTQLRFAEWYYGPQKRILTAYNLNFTRLGLFDELKFNVNYQNIHESRITREFRILNRFDSRFENVKVFGTTLNGLTTFGRHSISIGADMQLNNVSSTATRKNLSTGAVIKLDSRYPDGNNRMNNYGIFAQHTYVFSNKKLVLNNGIRFQMTRLKSNIVDNSFFNLPVTNFSQNNNAATGNVGLVYTPQKATVIKTSIASGFRSPNIDDLAKVFESNTAARQVVLPNANLKPEYTYNGDLTIIQTFYDRVNLELTGFYTLFTNAIVKAPTTLNGQDSILYNNIKSQVLANQNVNKARIYGFSAGIKTIAFKGFSFSSSVSYTKGRFQTNEAKQQTIYEKQPDGSFALVRRNVSSKPLDHIPPLLGRTGIEFSCKKVSAELFALYNGWKYLDDYNPDGEDNPQYATQYGSPAWATINLKINFSFLKFFQLQTGVENIFDKNYRPFASGFSAAGRNIFIALRSNF